MNRFSRVVTLGAELPEIFDALHLSEVIVGVSGFTRHPDWARQRPKVGGFTSVSIQSIEALQPDLVISTSHLQHQIVGQLASLGYTTFFMNPATLDNIILLIEHIAQIFDVCDLGQAVVSQWRDAVYAPRVSNCSLKIHFEEWGDPIMAPIPWVAELLELSGVELAFPAMRGERYAKNRIVTAEAVRDRVPDAVMASWCGRRVDLESIRQRPGMDRISEERIMSVPSDLFLQPGLNLMHARRYLDQLLMSWSS